MWRRALPRRKPEHRRPAASATHCQYGIELHNKAARAAGATNDKLAQAAMVAAAIRPSGAVTHATHLFAG